MLQDLIELRENRWIPRIKKENPKTLKEIHNQAEAQQVGTGVGRGVYFPEGPSQRIQLPDKPTPTPSPLTPHPPPTVDAWATVLRRPTTTKRKENSESAGEIVLTKKNSKQNKKKNLR